MRPRSGRQSSAPAQLIGGILLASLVLSLTMTAYVTAAARPAAAVAPTRASMPPPAAFTPVPAAAEAQIASAAGQARSRLHFGAVETTSWKTLVLVYRQTDVSFRLPDGTPARLRASMPDEMLELVTGIAATTGNRIYNWSDGLADWQLTVALAERPLRQLEPLDNGYWVSPAVIEADLDRHAPAGRYDSVIVVWSPTGGELSVPMPAWGLTLPPGEWSNGAGYSSIATPAEEWWWTAAAAPEELLVHE
ncbi:MAG TPA: hypothetical protein VNW68_08780, partial [Candidatus Limnocylindria bacterium]|nr:hypothetical protein [Candidatus Limnocylindria bacterium]